MTGGDSDLRELLQRAGLEVVGHGRVNDARPAPVAWRPVIAGNAVPTVAVRDDRPDLVSELNRQWHRLAVEHGVIDGDGEFLISIAEHNCRSHWCNHWTRVRLTEQWDLAGILGPHPGRPEFVTMSMDGDSVLGATSEEYEVWLIAVDHFHAWVESWAQARAQETPQEHESGWHAVLRWKTAPQHLRSAWREGLARNAAAPASVLLRLLDVAEGERLPGASWLITRELPNEVVEAWIEHLEPRIRKQLAERWTLTAKQRERLLQEPDPKLRWIFAMCAVDGRSPLTEATFAQLAADPSAKVRAEVALHRDLPARYLVTLATDPYPGVRGAACRRAWPHLDAGTRTALIEDPDRGVRAEAVLLAHTTTPMPTAVFTALADAKERQRAARECLLTDDLAENLARSADKDIRHAVAANPTLAPHLVAQLGQDPDSAVRWTVSVRADLTEEERARVTVEIDPKARCNPLPWVLAMQDDPEAMRRCAASTHLLVRRSAACARNLPPDVVECLATDEDWLVRLFLAENCAQAPAEVLLEMCRTWDGYSAARFPEHPNFPRRAALEYAHDPDPRMRRLALEDPAATAELVEIFSRDPDRGVRWRAVRDPRLTPASVIRLLDDPDWVIREAAARDPRLTTRALTSLLHDSSTAASAAANPAIPADVMHHLLDRQPIITT
ncbi:HEAT repeat domain-containing protein [Streptacidiphilus neutrinimicus]|uniref:HEAT repeat domain-containing protein n=1 Tax=Streptacidiphilus neutrinimicus TaxID=105420 RepID=UPI000694FB5D|nr:HEAT repeat domain-containing protein [Streptacidiphilus neutrinimicus]